jgi:hypothetical protein
MLGPVIDVPRRPRTPGCRVHHRGSRAGRGRAGRVGLRPRAAERQALADRRTLAEHRRGAAVPRPTTGNGLQSQGFSAWSTTDQWRTRGAMRRPQATGDTGLSACRLERVHSRLADTPGSTQARHRHRSALPLARGERTPVQVRNLPCLRSRWRSLGGRRPSVVAASSGHVTDGIAPRTLPHLLRP